MKKSLVTLLMTFISLVSLESTACTVMLVTRGASADGSVMISHSNDGFGSDPNLSYVPAREHGPEEQRPVYPSAAALGDLPELDCYSFPHLVAPELSDDYNYPGRPHTKAIGSIPQVSHTYAYLDADYPVMNEHGLMLAECTDLSARLPEVGLKPEGGIFYSSELGRVALERCTNARDAVKLMGALIDSYGLWGTAESLIVADKNEGWIFEMQPCEKGGGGFWIAERIPDGHFFIAANQLRIRAIRPDDENQLYNPKLPEQLIAAKWAVHTKSGQIDWSLSLQGREYVHPYYSLRRVWRAFDRVAPSKGFAPKVQNWSSTQYPLSVKPDRLLTAADLMQLHRDYYQDTAFDKSQSSLAGLYGSPYHYGSEKGERAILTAKSSYTVITQTGGRLAQNLAWFSVNAAGENPYLPLTVAPVPEALKLADRERYDASKLYWISSQVSALVHGYYKIMQPLVKQALQESEDNSRRLVEENHQLDQDAFNAVLSDNVNATLKKWQDLYVRMLLEYNLGAGIKYDDEVKYKTPKSY
ncbi:MAG: C69 family dipeptidase [Succinivibrio sp.]|nr:C69 family dipeptidase [Succinivibrio sp.]